MKKTHWISNPLAIACAALFVSTTFVNCECGDVPPCEGELKAECGKPCEDDTDCAAGVYCGVDKKCTADCTQDGDQCEDDQRCTYRGRCEEGGAGGGFGGSMSGFPTGGNGGEGGECPGVEVVFQPQTPTVILLIDQSGSMTANFGNGNRWDVLHDVLMDPNTGIVKQLEGQVRFGLALYTGEDTCPLVSSVGIALGNHAAIEAVYGPAQPLGETPTGDSIDAILPGLLAVAEPGPKVIVLATDGEPDTCEQPNPQNGQGEAIAAAQNAFTSNVLTYIIAVGNEVSATHQQDMANAGTGKPLDHSQGDSPYYPANNQQALVDAFDTIINGVRSCKLTLNGSIDPAKAQEGTVTIDGAPIPYGPPDGWVVNSPNEIELVGAACDLIQEGNHTVRGFFGCGVVIPD